MKPLHSVILIPVPEAEKVVSNLRNKYDRVVSLGVPAHITALFPFYEPQEITDTMIDKLTDIFSVIEPISFSLSEVNTFPGVVFLEPHPRDPFIDITKTIHKKFPDKPPYEGVYPEIHPHLTIAQLSDTDDFDLIKQEISDVVQQYLPIKSRVDTANLMVEDTEGYWHIKKSFTFQTA